MRASRILISIFLVSLHTCLVARANEAPRCKAWLVQSIPTDMPRLARVPGVLSTEEVFRWLAGNATEKLDMIVQYWQLVASPDNLDSGDYGYSEEEMKRFGADAGASIFRAIAEAADRNVRLRIVQHSGVYPDYCNESSLLASGRPNVQNVTLLLGDWWGSGIVHAKVWIADGKDIYIGSANNDWKSLTQVKEVGIYLVDCHPIVKKIEVYFHNLLKLSSLNSSKYSKRIWDKEWQVHRNVPCWSHFVDAHERCRSPLPEAVEIPHVVGYPALSDPHMFQMPIDTPGSNHNTSHHHSSYVDIPELDHKTSHHSSYISFSPPELSFGKFQSDEQAWVETITSVRIGGTVRISSMDWLGQSEYLKQAVYWSSLSSAISEVVFTKQATVKILVAYWAHNINNTEQYLKSLLYSNILCASSKHNKCAGKVEIKYYMVPGFDKTGAAIKQGKRTGNIYPAYTRVNHGKYAVSDVRAHIGTSNLLWDYFFTTAGVSFGTYNPAIVAQLQEIFDADWDSPYAIKVEPLASPWRTE